MLRRIAINEGWFRFLLDFESPECESIKSEMKVGWLYRTRLISRKVLLLHNWQTIIQYSSRQLPKGYLMIKPSTGRCTVSNCFGDWNRQISVARINRLE